MARLIDADALLAKFNKKTDIWSALTDEETANDFALYCKVADAVEEMPTIGGWINVKDRLPEEHADEHPYEFEQYLCATVWNDVRMVGFGTRIGDDKQHFWSGNSIWDDWVTHWMPLPEPPKEVAEE